MEFFKIKQDKIKYTDTSEIDNNYTDEMNKEYNFMAKFYDAFMFIFPLWKKWIKKVIPYIQGKKILEISFGTGYLMSKYSKSNLEVYGIDYNQKMVDITSKKLISKNIKAKLVQGNVEQLPYKDNTFDTIINTMAFSGYPNGDKALSEMKRVLKKDGKLLLVDFDFPEDRNIFGYSIVKLWEKLGDIMKDINHHLRKNNFEYQDISVGGFGSVHLFICKKR
ncbi:MAG: methyltransferase domain-containing protein [Nanoarchaeota archaeon]